MMLWLFVAFVGGAVFGTLVCAVFLSMAAMSSDDFMRAQNSGRLSRPG